METVAEQMPQRLCRRFNQAAWLPSRHCMPRESVGEGVSMPDPLR